MKATIKAAATIPHLFKFKAGNSHFTRLLGPASQKKRQNTKMGEWLREMLKLKGKMLSCFLQFPCFVGLSVLKCVLQSQQRYTNKMEAKVGANRKCSAQKQTQNKDPEMS